MDTFGWQFKQTDYFTPAELATFKKLRAAGVVSHFRTSNCEVCQLEILKGKKFCSITCKQKVEKDDE